MERNILQHIAIIPDANRRWAKKLGQKPWEGHRAGMERFREVADEAYHLGIKYLTIWAGSESNLTKRSKREVLYLAKLFREFLKGELEERKFEKRRTKVRVIGKWDEILQDKELKKAVDRIESESSGYQDRHLTILFGYNGTTEMMEAIKSLKKENRLDYETVKQALWTGFLPPVDMVIRTGGEPHWSAGFMMWLTSDSQFYFTEKFWPDFGKKDLRAAIADYRTRARRFGK
jgi:undecaprenyl diphosphate synthase